MNSRKRLAFLGGFTIGFILVHLPAIKQLFIALFIALGISAVPSASMAGGEGTFEFVNLKAGHYWLTARAESFTDFLVSPAQLGAPQTLRLDAALVFNSKTQTIEVQETAARRSITENATLAIAVVSPWATGECDQLCNEHATAFERSGSRSQANDRSGTPDALRGAIANAYGSEHYGIRIEQGEQYNEAQSRSQLT